jgi:DNA adenine methylase
MEYTKPLIKWVGGKTQIIDHIVPLIPIAMHNYWEPFVGGGSVLLAVCDLVAANKLTVSGKIHASDINPRLIGLYRTIQMFPHELNTEIGILTTEYLACSDDKLPTTRGIKWSDIEKPDAVRMGKEGYYYWIRNAFNREPSDTINSAAMFVFLNKTCFRGLYREGPNGFNVPFGNYKTPGIYDPAHILHISRLIQPVVFECRPFRETLDSCVAGDFVYLDPPYAPETINSFVSYTADGFGDKSHVELFDQIIHVSKNGITALMSNAHVKLVLDTFAAYDTIPVECRRRINSKNPETTTMEVLVRIH